MEKDKSTRSLHLKSKLLKNRPNSSKLRKTTKRSRNYNESIIENRKAGDYVKDTVIDVKITLASDRDDVKKVTEIKGYELFLYLKFYPSFDCKYICDTYH